MKVIDMSILTSELNKLEDKSFLLKIDTEIPKVSSMNIVEAAKYINQQEPGLIDQMIDRCQLRCNEDDEHEVEQLKRKVDSVMKDSKSIILFVGVF